MSSDQAEGFYYKADSFQNADSILHNLSADKLHQEWMEREIPDQSRLPEWMREPVWVIEIKVRRA